MPGFFDKLRGLIGLSRPIEWVKSLGSMLIPFIVASGFQNPNWNLFLISFIAVGPLLWSGLYMLNDYTDHEKDARHPVKKNRAIPSGKVMPKTALIISLILIAGSFSVAYFFVGKILFLLCLSGMMLNQFLYTLKPIELKKKPVIDLVSGSMINPVFRFYSGWFLASSSFNAPIELILFIVGFQFGGYTLYRLASKGHESELKYKSSAVVFDEKKIKLISYAAIIIGGISFFAAIINGILPQKYLLLAIISIIPLPLYFNALKDPQKMDIPFVYKLIYIQYTIFLAGFVALVYIW